VSLIGALIKKSAAASANYNVGSLNQDDGVDITWGTAVYDTHAFFSAGTNTRLTVPSFFNNLYGIITCNLSLSSLPADNNLLVSIRKNGSYQYIGFGGSSRSCGDTTSSGANKAWVSIRTAPILLTTGDYFEVRMYAGFTLQVETESSFGIRILTSNTQTQRCLVKKSADQTTANYSTISAIAWNSEIYDTDSIHDNVTNNTRLTVPSSLHRKWGVIEASVCGNNLTASSNASLCIQRNGSRTYDGFGGNSTKCGITTFGLVATTQPIELQSGDYFEAAFFTEDTSITILSGLSNFGLRVIEGPAYDGRADGQATATAGSPGLAVGLAEGFASVNAAPPSHGNADGIADVVGYSRDVVKGAGQADGFATVAGAAGVAAVGNADGFATVFSGTRPGGHAAILTAGI
jgi:hypothetical protein